MQRKISVNDLKSGRATSRDSAAAPISRVWLSQVGVILAGFAVLGTSGCGQSSAEQRLGAQLKAANVSKGDVFPLAGKVLVDGLPAHTASLGQRTVVVLFDRAKPDLDLVQRPIAECNSQGEFTFQTYGSRGGDGVAAGQYVVAIALLPVEDRGGAGNGSLDELKNLYNDPDRNAARPEFVIDHKSPGKKDYAFELKLAGEEPVTTPAPHAVAQYPYPHAND
jgi:hypothetical protein